ncbi:hypothetical protein [Rhizobium lusitanum]|uniref:hypothetical protein n=1 Tax=Rhizobium lusitanum TaxID=293958 RepID=UPI001959D806|nr:hypothetical protein [Rhizobium lusitanum]MBM7049707.1 hypothetical protein [Rhizobium lusitanum]
MNELTSKSLKPEWRLEDGAIILRMARIAPKTSKVRITCAMLEKEANAHVRLFYSRRASAKGLTVYDFIRLQAKAEGINYEILTAGTQYRLYYRQRQQVLIKTADRFPHLTSTQLGRLFHRDHTSILTALGRTASAKRKQSAKKERLAIEKVIEA